MDSMPEAPRRRATLDSVAEVVGVSKATVSKVLNDRPGVSEATRLRVHDAVRLLDYAPTTRAPESGGRRRILVLFDTLANLYSLRMLDALLAGGHAADVEIVADVIAPLDPGPASRLEPHRIRALWQRGYAGLLVVTTQLSRDALRVCAELDLPVVSIDPPNALDPDVASVGSNNWSGAMQATEHLLGLGHRRIGFVGGLATHAGLRERRAGYRSALEAAGLDEDSALVSEDGMVSAGPEAVRMMDLVDPPTAFFVSSDPGALAVMRELARAGLRVPDDVSVVGYDDTYAALPAPVLLTTVHTPLDEIGRTALSTVLAMIEGSAPLSHHLQLATSLVVRESTAAPRG
ncbi:LacI family transcriptional regulator [Frondihabitans sp. PhB188]|nr:LacI family transcriptional regulator [Frondihabitans sp. PhB188]